VNFAAPTGIRLVQFQFALFTAIRRGDIRVCGELNCFTARHQRNPGGIAGYNNTLPPPGLEIQIFGDDQHVTRLAAGCHSVVLGLAERHPVQIQAGLNLKGSAAISQVINRTPRQAFHLPTIGAIKFAQKKSGRWVASRSALLSEFGG
jgi:hypothetical protein